MQPHAKLLGRPLWQKIPPQRLSSWQFCVPWLGALAICRKDAAEVEVGADVEERLQRFDHDAAPARGVHNLSVPKVDSHMTYLPGGRDND